MSAEDLESLSEAGDEYCASTSEECQVEEVSVECSSRAQQPPGGKLQSSRALRRGRRPAKLDSKVRLERSQQSARECRARKKLRYQYLEELVSSREKAIYVLRAELDLYKKVCQDMDEGVVSKQLNDLIKEVEMKKE